MLKCSDCTQKPRYRYTLTLQSITGTAGADGQIDSTNDSNWTTTGTIQANFMSKGGREFVQAQRVQADVNLVAETPSNNFSRSITPAMRIIFESRVLQITAAYDVDEMRETVRIHLMEAK
jgi:SPP1 family predicted phage head-tail adaptor